MRPAAKPGRRALRRGSIIVPVLIVLVLLAYLATEVSRELASDYGGSAYLRTTVEPGGLLDNAESHAVRLLQSDQLSKVKTDNYHENWGELNEDLARMSSDDGPQLSGDIVDMCGLFPVNSLLPANTPETVVLKQYEGVFLRLVGGLMDAYNVKGDPKLLLEALRYWMGDPTASRNDSNWYADQPGEYQRPARAMYYPYELMLVHWEGVEDEGRRKVMLGSGGGPGLVDLVTTWGLGAINMNTAPEPVVRAVCPVRGKAEAFWKAVARYRLGGNNDFTKGWYVKTAKSVGIKAGTLPEDCLDAVSDAFCVRLQARMGAAVRRQLAVVLRGMDGSAELVFRQSY